MRADLTVTMIVPKPGLAAGDGAAHCGRVVAHARDLASGDEPHGRRDEQQVFRANFEHGELSFDCIPLRRVFYTGLGIALALAGVGFLVHYLRRDGYITCPVTGKVREG